MIATWVFGWRGLVIIDYLVFVFVDLLLWLVGEWFCLLFLSCFVVVILGFVIVWFLLIWLGLFVCLLWVVTHVCFCGCLCGLRLRVIALVCRCDFF